MTQQHQADGRRARGNQTRAEVLARGLELATVHGLNGFSLSDLASSSGISKAGIVGLFGPKEALLQAITNHARSVLDVKVFAPVRSSDRGIRQLKKLGIVWIAYLADPSLVGGCFFAPAFFELDAQPGHLRDSIRDDMDAWIGGIATMIRDGQRLGEIDTSANPSDEAFTFFSLGVTSNTAIQLGDTSLSADRATRLWRNHLTRLQTTERPKP